MSAAIAKGQKNDFRDAEAIIEAVQWPTMKFLAMKTADQLDPQALHRVRERLVSQRTGIINQIRAFLLERGTAVRQGQRFLRAHLPRILAMPSDVLSPRSHVCAGETVPLAPTYARVSSTTLAYAETVGSRFLSLRQSRRYQYSLRLVSAHRSPITTRFAHKPPDCGVPSGSEIRSLLPFFLQTSRLRRFGTVA